MFITHLQNQSNKQINKKKSQNPNILQKHTHKKKKKKTNFFYNSKSRSSNQCTFFLSTISHYFQFLPHTLFLLLFLSIILFSCFFFMFELFKPSKPNKSKTKAKKILTYMYMFYNNTHCVFMSKVKPHLHKTSTPTPYSPILPLQTTLKLS